MQEFTLRTIDILKSIPYGKVVSYGQVAKLAGNPQGARQVVRILKTQTKKYGLPWFRVINSRGIISIRDPVGFEMQRANLISEGIEVSPDGKVDMRVYGWKTEECDF